MSWNPTRAVGNATCRTHSRPLSDVDPLLCGPAGRTPRMGCHQPHSRGEVAHVDATVCLDADIHPCASKGDILHADR